MADEEIKCACGCGLSRQRYDNRGRERRYIFGHAPTGKTYEEIMGEKKAKRRKEELRKISLGKGNPFFNKHHTKEAKEIMGKRKEGKNHWCWKDGRVYYERKFREAIRKRDNHICILCFKHQGNNLLDVHHINYDNTLNIFENGITLCRSCHIKTNYNKLHWINFFQSLLIEKYHYQYSNNEAIINLEKNK